MYASNWQRKARHVDRPCVAAGCEQCGAALGALSPHLCSCRVLQRGWMECAAALATWNQRDSAACTQLMLHIASSQLRNADNDNNDKTARQVWVKLCNVYTDTSMAAQMAL